MFEAGGVELGAEADDADGAGFELPEGVEAGGGVEGVVFVCGRVVGAAGAGVRGPETPGHFELVGDVVVELLGGFGDGVLDDGGGGVLVVFGAWVGDVEALVDGGFGEGEGVGGGGLDAFACGRAAELGELAHDAGEGGGQGLEAEVGEPETEVELVGHGLDCIDAVGCRGAWEAAVWGMNRCLGGRRWDCRAAGLPSSLASISFAR